MLLKLAAIEWQKIIAKPRSWIGFGAIAAIVAIIQVALYADGDDYWTFLIQSLEQSFIIEGLGFNGNMVCFIILQTLIIQMPLLVAIVAGDSVSGERSAGTLRALMSKPVSRSRILTAKLLSVELYTFLLITFLGVMAWLLSLLFFGSGDMVILKSDELIVVRGDDTAWRFFWAFIIAFLSLSLVATFSFMLSVMVESSLTAIILTMSVIILFTIIGTFDIPLFNQVKPFLFTTHMIIWRNVFDQPLPMQQIVTSVTVILLHILVFTGIAYYRFNKQDITN